MGAAQSKTGPKITPHDRAVLDLKLQRDRIKQYQKRIQTTLAKDHRTAVEALAAGNKPLALTLLRRHKFQQTQLAQTDEQLATLQTLVSSIEFTQIQASVVEGLKQGNEVLRQLHQTLSVQQVESVLEESAERQQTQREIDEMIQSSMSVEEEEQVQLELEQLEREAGVRAPPVQVPKVNLPEAPRTEPITQRQEEDQQQQSTQTETSKVKERARAEPMLA